LGGGAIVGIVIGAILVLALIIGGWFFWRRRQRAKESALGSGDDEQARREGGTVLPAAQNSPQEKQTCHHPEHYYEMPGSEQAPAQELDPRDSAVSAMNRARHSTSKAGYNYEPTYELNPESRPGELPHGENEQASPVLHQNQEPASTTAGNEMTEASGDTVSPNVEAQRRREMEWLEMEEERIRKRRETLAIQGSGKA
jgi:FtsZ-interacting cell division protein ZipA